MVNSYNDDDGLLALLPLGLGCWKPAIKPQVKYSIIVGVTQGK
jgi:hypothetical protein